MHPFQRLPGEVVSKNHPRAEDSWVGSARGLSKNTKTFVQCSQNEERRKSDIAGDRDTEEVSVRAAGKA